MEKLNENSPLIGVTLSEVEDLQFSFIAELYASTAAFDEEDYENLLSFPPSICTSPNKVEASRDNFTQIDGNALTTALLAIGATMEQTEVEMTNNGTANGNNDNVVEDPLHMLFDAAAAQNNNAIMNNETVLVYNTNQRKVSTFSLRERLRDWIINEIRCPNAGERIYKLYVHLRSDVMFRSLNEVDDFVHFGYHPKARVMNGAKLTADIMSAEASTSKRKERELNWEFRCKGKSSDGDFTIYDIDFLKPDSNQDPDNDTGVNQETSEERKGDSEIEQNRYKRRKTLEIVDQEMVETLAHQNRMNKEAKGDKNKDVKGNGNKDKGKKRMYEDKGDINKDNNGNDSKDYGKGKMYED